MIDQGLTPRDPARWWLAVAVERELAERDSRQSGAGEQDIEIVDDGTPTL
jgi:hypothetical protein